jgi:hypothetical protein
MTKKLTAIDDVPLQTVRGLRYFLDSVGPSGRVLAQIRGVVVKKWSRSTLVGCWVLELTGQINVIVDRTQSRVDISAMSVGQRVIVAGVARVSDRQQLVIDPDRVEIIAEDSLVTSVLRLGSSDAQVPDHVVTSFLLARIRSITSNSASSRGYRQFEPYYISTPLEDKTAEPLMVSFEGWGSAGSLAVSPAPQLLQVLLETGEQRVFAIARCFSSAYRDGFSSAEQLMFVARQINISVEEAADFTVSVLSDLLREGDTAMGQVSTETEKWPKLYPGDLQPREVHAPCVEFARMKDQGAGKEHDVFRVLYPPGVAVAEGDVAEWSTNVRIGGVTIHLERLVSLLAQTSLAAIRHLGGYSPTPR